MDKKIFFSNDSSGEVGSICASINRTGKTNANKGPKVDFNAYKDFHDREIEAHIIASFMEFAVLQIVSDLISINAFSECPQRGYSGFAKFNANIISQLDYAQFYHWVRDKLKIWKEISDHIHANSLVSQKVPFLRNPGSAQMLSDYEKH